MTTHDNTAVPVRQAEPIRHDNLLINFTTEFLRIWDTSGSRSKPAAFWRPTPAADLLPGYFPLGDVAIDDHQNLYGRHAVAVVCEAQTPSADPARGNALSRPDDYVLIWKDFGSGAKKHGAVWRPVPPEGYVAMGSVCSDGYDKPSLNAVRCIRADLVSATAISEPVWDDKGSGARQNISIWRAAPRSAPPGEVHLSPGTFVGLDSYSRPLSFYVYSLRIPIPIDINPRPAAPLQGNETPASAQAPEQLTRTVRLPWFSVKDPQLSPRDQLRESSFYLLQRTDHYQLVGQCHNTENDKRTFRWVAPRAQRAESLRTFTRRTLIEFGVPWQSNVPRPFLFSASLTSEFTQSERLSNEWLNEAPIEVAAVVAKNSSMAVHVMQSDYTLLRADGTQVTSSISYTDIGRLHFSEYTPPEPDAPVVSAGEPQVPDTVTPSLTNNEITATPEQTELPTATDSAP